MSRNFWDLLCSKMKVNQCDSFFWSVCTFSRNISTPWRICTKSLQQWNRRLKELKKTFHQKEFEYFFFHCQKKMWLLLLECDFCYWWLLQKQNKHHPGDWTSFFSVSEILYLRILAYKIAISEYCALFMYLQL